MAPQPQRRTDAQRKTHLDASVVPIKQALLHRAAELETANPPDERVDIIALTVAREFRALAEELHYW